VKDWLVIVAALLGPILAVQAQKAVEGLRERRGRKLWVFHNLMATRAGRLSADHVQALNMIDLAFYGSRIFGISRRSRSEQAVIDAWREYHDHLGDKFDEESFAMWNTKGDELFINLLFAIAKDVGFKFDRVQLKKGSYTPIAHGNLEYEQNAIRKLALKLLSGESSLKMDVASFPIDDEALKTQLELQRKLAAALDGDGALRVEVKQQDKPA
jgi:hypothetical protein